MLLRLSKYDVPRVEATAFALVLGVNLNGLLRIWLSALPFSYSILVVSTSPSSKQNNKKFKVNGTV